MTESLTESKLFYYTEADINQTKKAY